MEGQLWLIIKNAVKVGYENGKRKFKTKGGFTTKTQA